jgi:hypothetical protein
MLAEKVDYVIGVDTHRDQHTLAVVAASTGAVVAQHAVTTTVRGYAAAVVFAERYATGVRVWAIEGAGHYGAGFTRYLSSRGQLVIEVGRTARSQRRLQGKDDTLDAVRAARSTLASTTLTLPRAGQRQEALRVLLLTRRSAVDVRRLALVQLRSVIVTAPENLRDEIWIKLLGNAVFNPLSVLTRATLAAMCRHPGTRALAREGMIECLAIANALGAQPQIDIERRLEGAERVQVGDLPTAYVDAARNGLFDRV